MPFIPTFNGDGYRPLTLEEIRFNLREYVETASALGAAISTGLDTIAGNILDAFAIGLSVAYDRSVDVWAGFDVNQATGVDLDERNQLRGVPREDESKSTVILQLGGTAGTPVPANSIVAVPNGGPRWLTDSDVVLPDNVNATAEDAGPILVSAGTIIDIVTGVSGWTSVTNPADQASIGRDVESDADYRLRAEQGSTGSVTEEAIWSRLVALTDVEAAVVDSNRSKDVDANGTPPNHHWIIVYPATVDPTLIAETIWGAAGTAPGIGFRGAQTATVTDKTAGVQHQIAWDWATELDLWLSFVGTKDGNYPPGGDDLVRDAAIEYFDVIRVGQDVYPAPVEGAITAGPSRVPGIKELEARLKIGSAPGPGDTAPIEVAINEYAELSAVPATNIGVDIT